MSNASNDPRFAVLRAAYRAAAATAERPEATAADHAAWLAAQAAYYKAGGRDPANGWPASTAKSYPDDKAFDLGHLVGEQTGRAEPTDSDIDWLAKMTDGQSRTEPDFVISFIDGMKRGAHVAPLRVSIREEAS